MCRVTVALCLLSFLSCSVLHAAPGKQEAKSAEAKLKINYLLALPDKYDDDKEKKWPVMIFLHGSGERGNDLEKVKVHGPPKLIEQGKSLPFIVVSPQCPADQMWDTSVLSAMLDAVIAENRVDESRIYLTGLSMGGFGTWDWAMRQPKRFAAIVPICGGGNPFLAGRLKNTPTWVFHGAKDAGVPVKLSQDMVDAIKKAGGEPKLTVYPELEHDSWTVTYENPELYKWLLEQKRPDPAETKSKEAK
jgi:predicted peptidase